MMWWVRQVLSRGWGGGRAMPALGLAPRPFPVHRSCPAKASATPVLWVGGACHKGNKSPAGRPGPTPLRPRHSHATARVLEAGLNQVPGYGPAGNKTTIRGRFLMAPAQRTVLSEQRCRRPAGAAIRCMHVFPGSRDLRQPYGSPPRAKPTMGG